VHLSTKTGYDLIIASCSFNPVKKQFLYLQTGVWVVFFGLFYLYISERLSYAEWYYRFSLTLSSFVSFACIIYGYVLGVYRKLSYRWQPVQFVVAIISLLIAVLSVRLLAEFYLVRPMTKINSILDLGRVHLSYTLISCSIALLIGILLTAVEENIISRQNSEILKRKQLEAELRLLKYQLQPHFLFNFLNNLYSDVYKVLPETGEHVLKGAEVMRYFMYHASLERVPLSSEVRFMSNLIDLEKSRLKDDIKIKTSFDFQKDVDIPPMLFAPVIENIFKHGTRQVLKQGEIKIRMEATEDYVLLETINPIGTSPVLASGIGLRNLEERLDKLYATNYLLEAVRSGDEFLVKLKIPVL